MKLKLITLIFVSTICQFAVGESVFEYYKKLLELYSYEESEKIIVPNMEKRTMLDLRPFHDVRETFRAVKKGGLESIYEATQIDTGTRHKKYRF